MDAPDQSRTSSKASLYPPNYPPTLDTESESYKELVHTANDWALGNGAIIKSDGAAAVPVPMTLFPSLFPSECFREAMSIQKGFNLTYANIAMNRDGWLEAAIKELAEVDDFVKNLYDVHLHVLDNGGYKQEYCLGLFRSDYMIHSDIERPDRPEIRQVEFNTIASSFGGLSTKVSQLHQFLIKTNSYSSDFLGTPPNLHDRILILWNKEVQKSDSAAKLAKGLSVAHTAHMSQLPDPDPSIHHIRGSSRPESIVPCIIFLVQDPERNIFDQRIIEWQLQRESIPCFRVPFRSLTSYLSLSASDNATLIYMNPNTPNSQFYTVSVVYFRAGYAPDEYAHPGAWQARQMLERSSAILCPDVMTQLAGSKKVQQLLTAMSDQDLDALTGDRKTTTALRRTFAPMYPLGEPTPLGQKGRDLALNPHTAVNHVLKPQREGGGNNIYGAKIPDALRSMPGGEKDWRGWVLMELISPPKGQRNIVVRNGEAMQGEVVCELGVFGTVGWSRKSGKVLWNKEAGYLCRTKGSASEEGGVAAGFGAVDSVILMN